MADSYHIPFGRFHNGGFLLYHPYSQYGDLRLIDDRRTEQRLERAEIGNRKRTARYIIGRQFVDARFSRQAVYRNGRSASRTTGTIRLPSFCDTAIPTLICFLNKML